MQSEKSKSSATKAAANSNNLAAAGDLSAQKPVKTKKAATSKSPADKTQTATKETKSTVKKKSAATKTTPGTASKIEEASVKPAVKSSGKKVSAKKTSKKSGVIQLTFELGFSTRFGQNIKLCGEHPALGAGLDQQAIPLVFKSNTKWSVTIELDPADLPSKDGRAGIQYYYLVEEPNAPAERSANYLLALPGSGNKVYIKDAWNSPAFVENAFTSDVFSVLQQAQDIPGKKKAGRATHKKANHHFHVSAPRLEAGQAICLLGNHTALGNWAADKAILLSPQAVNGSWSASILLPGADAIIEYKYGIYDLASKALIAFEQGDNRSLLLESTEGAGEQQVVIQDGFYRTN
ncbi:MAG TPA: carbohydrate-binding module family 20 domain-containing protein [Arachidicoccus sp.]|nr:carbohydrate-binding module family 20 domain-containing protein [Arachidicoccus sp.]